MNGINSVVEQQIAENDAPAPRSGAQFQFTHFPQLDGFRGLAVLLVLVGHGIQFSIGALSYVAGSLAALGVLLFFVLSGFLITGLLYREKLETGEVNLGNFYARRVLRLGPGLFVFLAITAGLVALKKITDVPWYEIAVCLLYVRNIYGRSLSLGHLWSLSLEEQFYFLWPQVLKRIEASRLLKYTVISCALICAWRGYAIYQHLFDYNVGIYYTRPYMRFDSILIGCCIALAAARSEAFLKFTARISSAPAVLAAWGLLFVWTMFGEQWSAPLYITIQMLGCALVLAQIALGKQHFMAPLFTSRALRYLGRISYSLYLWQQLFLVTKNPSWGVLRTPPVNVLLAFACAMISYHFVEAPILRFKTRFKAGSSHGWGRKLSSAQTASAGQ